MKKKKSTKLTGVEIPPFEHPLVREASVYTKYHRFQTKYLHCKFSYILKSIHIGQRRYFGLFLLVLQPSVMTRFNHILLFISVSEVV